MSINSKENYYVAKCNTKINSTCKFAEEEYLKWNGKCCYGRDDGIYCTAKFNKVEVNKEQSEWIKK